MNLDSLTLRAVILVAMFQSSIALAETSIDSTSEKCKAPIETRIRSEPDTDISEVANGLRRQFQICNKPEESISDALERCATRNILIVGKSFNFDPRAFNEHQRSVFILGSTIENSVNLSSTKHVRIIFRSSKIKGDLDLAHAQISDRFEFSAAEYPRYAAPQGDRTRFPKEEQYPREVKCLTHDQSNDRVRHSVLKGKLILTSMEARYVSLTDSEFHSGIDASDLEVTRTLDLAAAIIHGEANFRFLRAGIVQADGVLFQKGLNMFAGQSLRASADFSCSIFNGPVSLQGFDSAAAVNFLYSTFRTLGCEDCNQTFSLNLVGATAANAILVNEIEADQAVNASHSKSKGLTFVGSKIAFLSLDGASTEFLNLDGLCVPDQRLSVRNLTYQSLSFGPLKSNDETREFGGYQSPAHLANSAQFDLMFYDQLEHHLADVGDTAEADNVYFALKRRQRDDSEKWSYIIWSLVADGLFQFGRAPWLVWLYSFFIVVIGAFVFRNRNVMQPTKTEFAEKRYSAVWYSLDLFIPMVNLRSASYWEPRQCRRWATNYMRLQIALGWLLIPIGLLALTGFFK